MSAADLRIIWPELVVAATAMAVLVWDLLMPRSRSGAAILSILGLVAAGAVLLLAGRAGVGFGGTYLRDALTQVLQLAALVTAVLGTMLGSDYFGRSGKERSEYYALLLTSTLGAMVMAASGDLLVLFLGLETLSLPLYVMAAFARGSARSQEAGLKYFLLGSFSTAFFLYGVALLYGAAGSTALSRLTDAAVRGLSPALAGGVALLTIGLAFKAALVPFHTWAPDVYEGSPMPATAFMAVIAKVGAFAALIRVFMVALPALAVEWTTLLAVLSGATMILGNLVALVQRSMKRLLAYSSIAHAGYLLMGVAAGNAEGVWATAYYLLVYLFMTLGAFAVVLVVARGEEEAEAIDDYAGLGARAPWLAAAMTVFMVSLAGMPPAAGFIGKLYLFRAALAGGQTALVLVAALTTVVSVYYYLRVPFLMFAGSPQPAVELVRAPATRIVVVTTALAVLAMGILPGPVTRAVQPLAALVRR